MIAPVKQPTLNGNTLLLEFYKAEFIPQRLAGAKLKYKQKFVTSIAHLRAFLKRPPVVSDLDSETFEELIG